MSRYDHLFPPMPSTLPPKPSRENTSGPRDSRWIDYLVRSNPGATRDDIISTYTESYGSLEAAEEAETAILQAAGVLPAPEGKVLPPPEMQIGRLPRPGEPTQYAVIDEHYGLRIWGGDLMELRQFSFGFYDRRTKQPVNTPSGYTVHAVPERDTWGVAAGQLHSIAEIFELDNPPEGSDTYIAPENLKISVKPPRPRQPVFIRMPLWPRSDDGAGTVALQNEML